MLIGESSATRVWYSYLQLIHGEGVPRTRHTGFAGLNRIFQLAAGLVDLIHCLTLDCTVSSTKHTAVSLEPSKT